jgi:hypothetical protein
LLRHRKPPCNRSGTNRRVSTVHPWDSRYTTEYRAHSHLWRFRTETWSYLLSHP